MIDKNIYHLTMKSVNDLPDIHGDIHRPSDFNLDKIYLLSKISDVLMDNRDFGVITGFEFFAPTGASIIGNQETGELIYTWNLPTNNIQFNDGYVVISHRFLDNISTHDKTGVELPHPVKITHYFGILYCPKENNIINLNAIPNGVYYIYIKYKYDTSSNKLLVSNVSRQRTKVSIPILYTFLGADFYSIEVLDSIISQNNNDYYNYVLLGKIEKSNTNYVLELKGYNSFRKLTDLVKLYPLNSDSIKPELIYKIKDLEKRYYVQSFEDVYNYLNLQTEYVKLEHKYPNINGTLLVNNHFKYDKGILQNGDNLIIPYLDRNKFIVLVQNDTETRAVEIEIFSKSCIVKNNTFSSADLILSENTNNLIITNNSGESLNYFIFKIDTVTL